MFAFGSSLKAIVLKTKTMSKLKLEEKSGVLSGYFRNSCQVLIIHVHGKEFSLFYIQQYSVSELSPPFLSLPHPHPVTIPP